jgi:hypothetical protein
MSSFNEARLEGFIVGIMITVIPYVLYDVAKSRDIIEQHPEYFLQRAEMQVAQERCKKNGHGNLFGVGAVKLYDGRIRYKAICTKEGEVVTWVQ